ncbi:response regulator [Myxococcota bacterium]|nr:response regulator [Myxococcota bacterium]
MSSKRKILIVDSDVKVLKLLHKALSTQYEISLAKDGSKALELSVLKYPDLILFDRHVGLIGAAQFLKILRANPRTEDTPLIVLSDHPLSQASVAGLLEGVLVKPLNIDEVRSYLLEVFRRLDAAHEVSSSKGSVGGSLEQLSVVDLLQVFSVNRRSGCISVFGSGGLEAEVYLDNGRIVEAVVGFARGEKALFRLLAWTEGSFSFVPDQRSPTNSLNGTTDGFLMEGMRQSDEFVRLWDTLPGADAQIELLKSLDEFPSGLHPVTQEILELSPLYPRMGDLLDRAKATDLEVLVALQSLIDARLLRVVEDTPEPQQRKILSSDEILELRSRLRQSGLARVFVDRPKVAIVSTKSSEVSGFGVAMARFSEFAAGELRQVSQTSFGHLGDLRLERDLTVDFTALPLSEGMTPLGLALSAGVTVIIVLGVGDFLKIESFVELLSSERRAPVLIIGGPDEMEIEVGEFTEIVRADSFDKDNLHTILEYIFRAMGSRDMRIVGI